MIVFSSLEFIFRFLLIFLIIYYVVPKKFKMPVLLLGSLIFYGVGEPILIVVLIVATLLNYYWSLQMYRLGIGYAVRPWQENKRKHYLIGAVLFDVIMLVVFKCLGVFVSESLLPLGISFYTFKMISYQIDCYKKTINEAPSFLKTAVYFTMFPQVVSGPIMRYDEGSFEGLNELTLENFEEGLKYFVIGLGMKVILADRVAILWNDLQMIGYQSISTPLAWLGAFTYSMELYFDFWGYSLMASGILVMLGYNFIRNFDHPYSSKGISEFYRRWHMTLGSFFRDYLYFPLGGSRTGQWKILRNLMIVWAITGLWHGSGFNFLIWGVVLGLLIVIEKFFLSETFKKIPFLGWLYMIFFIPLTWVVFAISDLGQLGLYFTRLFPFFGTGLSVNSGDILKYLSNYWPLLLGCLVLLFPQVGKFYDRHKKNLLFVVLLTAVFWYSIYLITSSSANPFMYFKF